MSHLPTINRKLALLAHGEYVKMMPLYFFYLHQGEMELSAKAYNVVEIAIKTLVESGEDLREFDFSF